MLAAWGAGGDGDEAGSGRPPGGVGVEREVGGMWARRLCFTRKRAPQAPHAPHQIARVGCGACRGTGTGDGDGGGGDCDPAGGLAKGSPRRAVRGAGREARRLRPRGWPDATWANLRGGRGNLAGTRLRSLQRGGRGAVEVGLDLAR
jgi:hypothetical protein